MKQKITAFTCTALFAACLSAIAANLKTDPVFTSNMMLQQEKPIAFFGTADKGTGVTVTFADRKVSVKADSQNNWKAVFPAMKAGKTNYTATITDGSKKIELKDILIGDVWVCAGQSNMEMPIGKVFRRGWSAQNCSEEVAKAKYPEIRYADQQNVISHNKLQPARLLFNRSWVKCDPSVAAYFSATAYFFARQLHKDTGLPIGLINLTWSGTRIEPWISLEGYKAANLESDLATIKKFTLDAAGKKAFEAQERARFSKQMAEFEKLIDKAAAATKEQCTGYSEYKLDTAQWPNANNINSSRTVLIRWYRSRFTTPKEMVGKKVTLRMPKFAEEAEVFLNGKLIASYHASAPESEKKLEVTLGDKELYPQGDNVLALRCTYLYGWSDRSKMNQIINNCKLICGKKTVLIKGWKQKNEIEANIAGRPGFINYPYTGPQFQSNLYNGMVDAWTKLPVKGVIWYQGCSNNGQLHYLPLHKAMIADWRAKWKQPDMPFMIVQLAGYGDWNWHKTQPYDAPYAITRDIQMQLTKDPKVGLACAIDIGEATNIHPANKQEVGRRLALEAERIAYGKKILSRGPIFDHIKIEGSSIRVFFKNADKGLKTCDGEKPGAFAIAGADKKFVWADAKIDGNTVVVSSPNVKKPQYVRYAFVMYRGDCNLHNTEGLAAYPFRSDAFDYSKVK